MAAFTLTAKRGDTIDLLVLVTRDNAAVDLTGADVWFTAKRSLRDADVDAVVQKTIGNGIVVTDALAGEALVTIDPSDTNGFTRETRLFCDVQVIEPSGRITTVADGTLTITLDVTRAVA